MKAGGTAFIAGQLLTNLRQHFHKHSAYGHGHTHPPMLANSLTQCRNPLVPMLGTYPTLPERVVIDLRVDGQGCAHALCNWPPAAIHGSARWPAGHGHNRAAAWCGNWKVPLYPCTSVSPVYRLGLARFLFDTRVLKHAETTLPAPNPRDYPLRPSPRPLVSEKGK